MFDAKNCPFCLKKLSLRHFCRECRKNLNIRVFRTKFWVKSACEDAPQVVPAWFTSLSFAGQVIHRMCHAFHEYVRPCVCRSPPFWTRPYSGLTCSREDAAEGCGLPSYEKRLSSKRVILTTSQNQFMVRFLNKEVQ